MGFSLSSLMGGGGVSSGGIGNSQASNTNETDSRTAAAFAQGEGNITYSVGDGTTMIDGGIIKQAFEFASALDASQRSMVDSVLGSNSTTMQAIKDGYAGSTQAVLDAKTADSKYMMIAGLVVVALMAIQMMGNR